MPSPRRILIAFQPLHSGVANHVLGVVENLPRDRFEIEVACPPEASLWDTLARDPTVTLHAIEPHRHPHPGDVRSAVALTRLAARADVVHVHSAKAGFLGRAAAAVRGRRSSCVFTPHGWSFWAASGAEARLYARLERLAAHWCRTIVTLSDAERAAGLEAGIGRPEQYRTIPNGVPLERFAGEPSPVSGRILFLGRLAPPKRADLALRAFAEVRRELPASELWFVGDGRLRPDAEGLASELGLREAVRFLGTRDDVPELLASAHCVVHASDYEGCPLAVIEAMAAGVAVVATDVGGTGEVVADGVTGLLTPPDDAAALARALVSVLGGEERSRELGRRARREAQERLSLRGMVDRLVELYEEMPLPSG